MICLSRLILVCDFTHTHLESNIELIRIVDGDNPLVGGLVLEVEVQLYREDEHRDLAVQNRWRRQP